MEGKLTYTGVRYTACVGFGQLDIGSSGILPVNAHAVVNILNLMGSAQSCFTCPLW